MLIRWICHEIQLLSVTTGYFGLKIVLRQELRPTTGDSLRTLRRENLSDADSARLHRPAESGNDTDVAKILMSNNLYRVWMTQ
jgi:hypothetical protein